MNRLFHDFVRSQTPALSPEVQAGLSTYYLRFVQQQLHEILLTASKGFPKGFYYEGCEACSPIEEYREIARTRAGKRTYDLAESDLFMVRLTFSFQESNGIRKPLPPRYLYLPYVRQAGTIRLSTTLYSMTGVLIDKVISPGPRSVFVRLLRDRLTFYQLSHSVLVNNRRETFNVVWSPLYRNAESENTRSRNRVRTVAAHYLFGKYGVTPTFQKYLGFTPVFGNWSIETRVPPGMVVCRSAYYGTTHRPDNTPPTYQPSTLYLLVPESKWSNETAAYVAALFYIIDHFPHRCGVDRMDSFILWRLLLGFITFSEPTTEGRLHEKIDGHFASLDLYLDPLVETKLHAIGWKVESFYDLLHRIIEQFPKLLLGSAQDHSSMYAKNVEILHYVLELLTFKIFRMCYALQKAESYRGLTQNRVITEMNRYLTPRGIYHINRNTALLDPVSYCGDLMFPKITSKISEQSATNQNNRSAKSSAGFKKMLHSSMVEAGNILFVSKANASPDTRINPYVRVDLPNGTFIMDPELQPIIQRLQLLLDDLGTENISDDEVSDSDPPKIFD